MSVTDGTANSSLIFKLTLFIVTGLEPTSGLRVSVYPNPVNEKLIISLDSSPRQASYVLRDILGHEITSRAIEGNTAEVNTGSLSPGLYILDLQVDGVGVKRKIIKQY